ncbi:hypothetical protein KGF56_002035 [Candida oxycetoniae]|uniref:Growth regulation protein n=1 Tax=Candida oxycetoniae TaxID=497107 RepID=A0AAI9SXT3_9ASCO|nr:uncharacterized protein KGF56_002035 [Candida oxycetoniae]KAI3405079.2 hypothetical protein KGF56_002035 [Candida oxycetoniae]
MVAQTRVPNGHSGGSKRSLKLGFQTVAQVGSLEDISSTVTPDGHTNYGSKRSKRSLKLGFQTVAQVVPNGRSGGSKRSLKLGFQTVTQVGSNRKGSLKDMSSTVTTDGHSNYGSKRSLRCLITQMFGHSDVWSLRCLVTQMFGHSGIWSLGAGHFMMSQHDIITQVTPESSYSTPNLSNSETQVSGSDEVQEYNSLINLNIRGKDFTITRDELMSLPESILLCLFPNGVFLDANGQIISNLTENDVIYVNFDPTCFQYIIDVFSAAQKELEEIPSSSSQQQQQIEQQQQQLGTTTPTYIGTRLQQENILQTKPAIIVLREDLDFYVIPPISGLTMEEMKQLKSGVSVELLKNKLIFSGLGYKFDTDDNDCDFAGENMERFQDANEKKDSSSKGLGPAEQHLFDMLCSSGFEVKDKWGSRSLEPGKCVISSLSLVRLRTQSQKQASIGGATPPESPSLTPVTSQSNGNGNGTGGNEKSGRSRPRSRIAQLANSASRAASRSLSSQSRRPKVDQNQTKLLLFWRKPARKCWWSHGWITVTINAPDLKELEGSNAKIKVKVHIRRVWTLELSVIGVQ